MMRLDPKKAGENIARARRECGFSSAGKLAAELRKLMAEKVTDPEKRITLSRQTVENWEKGEPVPPWGQLALLTELFEKSKERPEYDGPYDEERLLFGKKRTDQLQKEKQFLVRVGPEEMALLSAYLAANSHGQETIIENAQLLAKKNPAKDADVIPIRSKS